MTKLYLIRHGEASGALNHIIGDSELSRLGVMQAERLRDRLSATREIEADILLASTLKRARQTAEIIAPALNLSVNLDESLQEMKVGEAEGLREDEYKTRFGSVDFDKAPFRPIAPGGEYWGQFMLRVGTALDRIIHLHEGKTIVIVCHGGVIDGAFQYFYRMPTLFFPPVRLYANNTSITTWQRVLSDVGNPGWRL